MKNQAFKKVLGFVGIFFVTLGIFMAGYYYKGIDRTNTERAVSATATQFVEHVLAGKSMEAYDLISQDNKNAQKLEDFASQIKGIASTQAAVGDATLYQTNGQYFFVQEASNVPEKDGRTNAMFYLGLASEGNNWRVSNYTIY